MNSTPLVADSSAPKKTRGSAWPYVVVALVWLPLILIYASQMMLTEQISWRAAFGRAGSDWLPWVALAPAAFLIAARFPIGPGRILVPVLVSIVVCIAGMYLAEWGFQNLRPVLTGEPFPASGSGVMGLFGGTPRAGIGVPVDGPARGYPPPPGLGPPERPNAPPGYPAWIDEGTARGPGAGAGPGPGGFAGRAGPGGRGPGGASGPGGPGGRGPAAQGGGSGQGPMQHMMHFHFPISLFVIMASNAYAYFLQMRDRERKASELARNLAEARLSALQMQLHPHFLFNALNATTALIRRDPTAAEEMIANLSELLRLALSVRDRHEVTMAQELDYLECYLAIEHVRFGDRLKVHWDVDETAKTARVPVLLLQPIVENAIRHGIERRNVDIGEVWISVVRDHERLHLSVGDNGPGPKAGPSTRRGHGVGLDNTRARLATLHAAAADVQIGARPGGGCMVTIDMPFQSQSSDLHENQSAHR